MLITEGRFVAFCRTLTKYILMRVALAIPLLPVSTTSASFFGGTSGITAKRVMAQLGNCIARLHDITGVVRVIKIKMLRMSLETKRIKDAVILATGIISSLWKLRLCIYC